MNNYAQNWVRLGSLGWATAESSVTGYGADHDRG